MRRPLCFFVGLFILGIFTRYIWDQSKVIFGSITLVLLMFLLVVGSKKTKKQTEERMDLVERGRGKKISIYLMVLFFLIGFLRISITMAGISNDEYIKKDGKQAWISGIILDAKTKENTMGDYYILTIKGEDGNRFQVYCYKEPTFLDDTSKNGDIESNDIKDSVFEGRKVRVQGKLQKPQGQRNPGCFDYALYLKSKKIYMSMKASVLEIGKVESGWRYELAKLKVSFKKKIENSISHSNVSLLMAMLFGDKSELEDEQYSQYQRNGTGHILTVSGLHVGMVYAMFVLIMKKKRSKIGNMAIMIALLAYAALSGFAPSVMRALIMIWIHIISQIFDERYDILTASMGGAFIILNWEPYYLFNVGFQMSFLCIIILAFTMPILERTLIPKLKEAAGEHLSLGIANTLEIILKLFLPIIVLQIALVPFTAYAFNYVSLSSFGANIPIVFLAGFTVPLGIIIFALSLIFGQGAFPLEFLASYMDKMLLLIDKWNGISYNDDIFSFNAVSPPLWSIFLIYGLGLLFCSEAFRIWFIRRKKKNCASMVIAIIILSFMATAPFTSGFDKCELVFIDVGQGDGIHLRTGKRDVLFDGGGKENTNVGTKILKPYFLKNNTISLDFAFFTHLHTDHFKGGQELMKEFTVDNVGISSLYKGNSQGLKNITYLEEGDLINIDKDVSVEVIWPEGGDSSSKSEQINNDSKTSSNTSASEDENEMNMVMIVHYEGVKIMITGDLLEDDEKKLIEKYKGTDVLKCDILKVAHHGSKSSSSEEFLDAVSPKTAIIQVGASNTYGHPHEETLKKLEARGIKVYRTDEKGAIGVEIKDWEYKILTLE